MRLAKILPSASVKCAPVRVSQTDSTRNANSALTIELGLVGITVFLERDRQRLVLAVWLLTVYVDLEPQHLLRQEAAVFSLVASEHPSATLEAAALEPEDSCIAHCADLGLRAGLLRVADPRNGLAVDLDREGGVEAVHDVGCEEGRQKRGGYVMEELHGW
jgi:hypothetical protein